VNTYPPGRPSFAACGVYVTNWRVPSSSRDRSRDCPAVGGQAPAGRLGRKNDKTLAEEAASADESVLAAGGKIELRHATRRSTVAEAAQSPALASDDEAGI
jgi:hypothetical protein